MPVCNVCGEAVSSDTAVCPICGAAVALDATTSFEPVSAGNAAPLPAEIACEGPALTVRKGPQPGGHFFLDRARITVGRDPESGIFLNDMTVSRDHAVISVEAEDTVRIRDVGSLNGTFINGVLAEEATLREGDIIQVGTFQMAYHAGRVR
ncbi:MAG: FHA domain-containing protein [Coriobacteriia bacterium]|nr:FHA domain-containing protein [Coriobacteriia bacterium]